MWGEGGGREILEYYADRDPNRKIKWTYWSQVRINTCCAVQTAIPKHQMDEEEMEKIKVYALVLPV